MSWFRSKAQTKATDLSNEKVGEAIHSICASSEEDLPYILVTHSLTRSLALSVAPVLIFRRMTQDRYHRWRRLVRFQLGQWLLRCLKVRSGMHSERFDRGTSLQ